MQLVITSRPKCHLQSPRKRMCFPKSIFFLTVYLSIEYSSGCANCSTFQVSFDTGKADVFQNEVLNVMSYHRSKMNEYLCKNYVANEIVEIYSNRSGENVDRRVGHPFKNSRLARESLLADPGSQKYKDWLSRSSTLEDIYKQFEHSEDDHSSEKETLHESGGEVTGYAVVGHKHLYSKPHEYGSVDSHFLDTGLGSHYHSYHEEDDEEEDHDKKGLKLKELFHFALTAIAFLAFATFMIEVVMCLMEVPGGQEPDYVLMPTSTGGTGPASKLEVPIPELNRQDRSLDLDPISMEILNTMSSKVLRSIEAMTILHQDDGQCLRRSLCQSTKYSKDLPGIQKIWLPLWSLATSWVAGRLGNKGKLNEGSRALEYLKAAVMGLGSQQCHKLYPKCDESRRNRKGKRRSVTSFNRTP